MHRNILTKYILLFLFSILVTNCGGEGSSIENNFIPVSINVFGLITGKLFNIIKEGVKSELNRLRVISQMTTKVSNENI